MKSKSLKTIAVVLGGAACISAADFAAAPGQYETGESSVPGSRDTSGQTTMPGHPSTMPGSGTGMGGTGSPSTMPEAGSEAVMPQSDAEILGVVIAIDDNQIAAAKAAAKEKMGSQAKEYGKMLKKQHSQNSDKTKKLARKLGISPTSNQTALDLRANGAQELATLVALEGKEFEKAYIDAMVSGHSDALQMIDAELLPAAKSEEVREHLGDFRSHVSNHLEEGKRLQEVQASLGE